MERVVKRRRKGEGNKVGLWRKIKMEERERLKLYWREERDTGGI